MPPELLSRILSEAIPHYDWRERYLRKDYTRFRTPLLLVCRVWRDIVISTPWMWSLIYISHQTNPDSVRRLVNMAKSAMLDIHLSMNPFMTENKEAIAAAAVKADQWRTLVTRYTLQKKEIIRWMPRVLPGLESAMLCEAMPTDAAEMVPTISAPNLRNLVVEGNSQFIFTECSELRDLELLNPSKCWGSMGAAWAENADRHFAWLTGAFPALERLSFDFTDFRPRDRDYEEDIPSPSAGIAWPSFPRLNALSFNRPTPHTIEYFLQKFQDSNPTILEFTGVDGRKYPHPRLFRMPPSCRSLRLYEQSLHSIRLFLGAFTDLPGVRVEVADTTQALGFTPATYSYGGEVTFLQLPPSPGAPDDRPSERDMEPIKRSNQIKEDWSFISSNAKVRWHFPQSTLEEGVEGIGVGKAIVYACQALMSRQRESYPPPNLETQQQLEAIRSGRAHV